MGTPGDWGFHILEVDGTSNYNYVRTVFEYTATIDPADHDPPEVAPGDLLVSQSINLSTAVDTYYVFRGSHDNNLTSGIYLANAPDGNMGYVSQAADYAEFVSYNDSDITTTPSVTVGSGHPAYHFPTLPIQYDTSFQPILDSTPIWMWLNIS
jgi:hypothetical protein